MNEKIEIDVQYSENDFIRGINITRIGNQSKTLNSIIYFVSTLLGYVLFYMFLIRASGPWSWNDAITLGVGAIVAITVAYALKDINLFGDRSLSREYKSSPLLKETYKIVFSELGIVSTSKSFESEIKWNAIIQTRETEDDFFFFTSPRVAMFVPSRVFTAQQQRDLQNLARRMLGAKAYLLQ